MNRHAQNPDDARYQAHLKREYEKEKRRARDAKRRKDRKKRILTLLFSSVFVCTVLVVVTNAFVYNISNESEFQFSTVNLPTEMNEVGRKDDVLSILIAVTDEDQLRTDALILAYFDKANGKVNLLNIPRDTYCNATIQSKKINAAYVAGIYNSLSMVEDLTGIMADRYIVANFHGLAEIIDILGGVEVTIPFTMKYDDPVQDLHIDLAEGTQILGGEQAVHFLRWRQNNEGVEPEGYINGDLGRIENTQEFINNLKSQAFKPTTILKIPQIINNAFSNIETDFSMSEIMWLATSALNVEIESFMLPGVDEYFNTAWYYTPFEEEIIELINEFFNPYLEDVTSINLLEK